jgi:type VII secretion-associated serine protease mycosin
MHWGGQRRAPKIARRARLGVTAAAAVLALVGGSLPARAAESDAAALPKNAWVVAQTDDGHLQVVTGAAAGELVDRDASGAPGPDVLSVEADQPVHALGGSENDPLRSQQWALDRVPFEGAWNVTRGRGVIVAIVDSGVEANHEDLAGSVLKGIDYVNPSGDGRSDPNGHGTHVAGIIAAHVNNGKGIAGAAPDVKILPVRVLDQNGGGAASNVAKGVIWATDHGARVINLSLGGGEAAGIQQAIQYANRKGAVVLAAAGNNGQAGNAPMYPAAYPEAIAVASVDSNLQHMASGNTGNYIDVSAPGVGVVSAWGSSPTAYASATGTSMATPYASAAAALIIAAHPSLSPARVAKLLESRATDLGPRGDDPVFGYGLINPLGSLAAAQPHTKGFGHRGNGYWVVGSDGRVRPLGHARFYGDLRGRALAAPIVAAARTANGKGYWLAGANGAVYPFGNAHNYGSMAGHRLSSPIVGMAATPNGKGYILLGADGGIFTFGNAHFYGSTGGMRLNARVLDLAMAPNGKGYWFVAADGGVFSFGRAPFHGSTGNIRLAAPVMSMTSATRQRGYWMVAADGGIFAFNVPFEGSMPGVRALTGAPLVLTVRMRALPSGKGYYLLAANGAVYAFGTAKNFGSAPGMNAVDLMLAP